MSHINHEHDTFSLIPYGVDANEQTAFQTFNTLLKEANIYIDLEAHNITFEKHLQKLSRESDIFIEHSHTLRAMVHPLRNIARAIQRQDLTEEKKEIQLQRIQRIVSLIEQGLPSSSREDDWSNEPIKA